MSNTANIAETTPWLLPCKRQERAVVRLFCLPYAGGGASVFRPWCQRLQQSVEIHPVQLPGRENRLSDPPFRNARELVETLAEALAPYLDKPFALFGHSMGAIIAFELARHLRRVQGVEPAYMFFSAHRAPQLPDTEPKSYALPDEELVRILSSLDGTPREVLDHPELLNLMLPLLRADFELGQTYEYYDEPPFNCPVTAFGGLLDSTTREELDAWREQTTAPFNLRMLNGGHFFLHTAQPLLLQSVARDLSEFAGASF